MARRDPPGPTRRASIAGLRARRSAGFTLIELVVTVAIIGLLAAAAVPLAELSVRRTKEHDLRVALREIRTAIDAYKGASDSGRIAKSAAATGYPPTLSALVDGVPDVHDLKHRKMYFLRRLPRDPMAADDGATADETWGKRSYESPPDQPQSGADVYDVYSLSDATAINGTPYRSW